MKIEENKYITENSTFRIKTIAKYFCEIESLEDLKLALNFANEKNIEWEILGGGSNTIFTNSFLNKLIIKNNIIHFVKKSEFYCADCPACAENGEYEKNDIGVYVYSDEDVKVKVSSGYDWGNFVKYVCEHNYFGIENLSFIPGTVGGAVVQNAGAYGSEIKDILEECEIYDIEKGEIKIFKNEDCKFSYRNSIFKNNKKYFVVSVSFKISRILKDAKEKEYTKEVLERVFKNEGEKDYILPIHIYRAVTEIRKEKLPDVKKINNVGSFFKNPIIEKEKLNKILEKFPNIIYHEVGENKVKIGAGRMLEILGFKGVTDGHFGTYEKHALSLIHLGGGDFLELQEFINKIKEKVKVEMDIEIEEEVVLI